MPLLLFLLMALSAMGQTQQPPFVFYGGAYHAATYSPAGLPNSGLPRGGLITVFGRNLGPTTPATANSFPLGANLSGVQVSIIRNTQTYSAFPVFVSAGQINAILPSSTPAGRAVLRVEYNNRASNYIPVDIVQANFGIFSVNSAGFGPAIVTNFIDAATQPLNSLEQAAQPGQVITIWGSGLGPVNFPDNIAPTAGDVAGDVTVFIGGLPAQRLYAGRAPCCSGLDQVVVTIPNNVPQGCWVPIQVRAGGLLSNTTTIAIGSSPTSCTDPHSPFSTTIRKGGKLARVVTARTTFVVDIARPTTVTSTFDQALAQFAEYPANPFAWQFFDSLPPVGTCVTHTMRGNAFDLANLLQGLSGTGLSAGSGLTLNTFPLPTLADLRNLLYGLLPSSTSLALPVTFANTGVAGVPAFTFSTTPNLTTSWTNPSSPINIDRSRPFNLTWTSLPSGLVLILAGSTNQVRNASSILACVARGDSASFSIPSHYLGHLSPSPRFFDTASAFLSVVSIPNPQPERFPLTGFDAGALHLNFQSRSVALR
jgi:uncharacterized protein (TIGR03437 family)